MKEKNYYIVLDVETAGGFDNPLVYDVGIAVTDKKGFIYEKYSFAIREIIFDKVKMATAYYKEKLPEYWKGIFDTEKPLWKVVNLKYVKKVLESITDRYNIVSYCAYNARFDKNALENTWLALGYFEREEDIFFDEDIPFIDIWNMTCQTVANKYKYFDYCYENGFISEVPNVRTSAEIVFGYLNSDTEYTECHTGLEDTIIECQIMAECFKSHTKIEKGICGMPWKIPQEKFHKFLERKGVDIL